MILTATILALTPLSATLPPAAAPPDDDTDLALRLANPLSTLRSVMLRADWDQDLGLDDVGDRVVLSLRPTIPFRFNENWNVISHTVIPYLWQDDVLFGGVPVDGLGDVEQSFFFTPPRPSADGLMWGVGPQFLLPTAQEGPLGADQWAIGPTGLAVRQSGRWTWGIQVSHFESVAGDSDREDISATTFRPFLSHVTTFQTTFGVETEAVYDWDLEEWEVPIEFSASQLWKIGGLPVQFGLGARIWADNTDLGPERLGFRAWFTILP